MQRKSNKNLRLSDSKLLHQMQQIARQEANKEVDSQGWIRQRKMQQDTFTTSQYQVLPTPTTGSSTANQFVPMYANANGYSFYNSAGNLVSNQLPNEKVVNQYFGMYEFYIVEEIEIVFHPVRMQILGSDDPVWQMPNVGCNIPQEAPLQAIVPTPLSSLSAINDFYLSMTARKGFKISQPLSDLTLKMKLPANLLARQEDGPMLRTNLSTSSRDLYQASVLNNLLITAFLNTTQSPRSVIGGLSVKMHWRVAGRINPDQPVFSTRETILSKLALSPCMGQNDTDQSDQVMTTDPNQIQTHGGPLQGVRCVTGCRCQDCITIIDNPQNRTYPRVQSPSRAPMIAGVGVPVKNNMPT